jgi:hypothetical protein
MKTYRVRGTLEVAIVDKQGIIRFQEFGFSKSKIAENPINNLLKK